MNNTQLTTTIPELKIEVTDRPIEAVEHFLKENYLSIIDAISSNGNTIKEYHRHSHDFIHFVEKNGLHLNTFADYKKAIIKVDKGISVKKKMFTVAKQLLHALYKKYGLLNIDLTFGIKGFTEASNKHKRIALEWEEIDAMIAYIEDMPQIQTYFIKTRTDKLIERSVATKKDTKLLLLHLLAFQGLREFEAAAIEFEGINLYDKKLTILGKGRDSKEEIDLHPIVIEQLGIFIKKKGIKSGFLFPHSKAGRHITPRAIRHMFTHKGEDVFNEFGEPIKKNLGLFNCVKIRNRTTHCFRHFFTTELLKKTNGDLNMVAKFTRHKSIQTVAIYDSRVKHQEQSLPIFRDTFSR